MEEILSTSQSEHKDYMMTKKKKKLTMLNKEKRARGDITHPGRQSYEKYLHTENIQNHEIDSTGCLLAMGLGKKMCLSDQISSYFFQNLIPGN